VSLPVGFRGGLSCEKSRHRVIQECGACGSTAMEPFFAIHRIPLSSCALFETREAAVTFGKGDLELAVCHDCGFIQNRLFEHELVDYTIPYEESQAFSPRFLTFQEELVAELGAAHDLAGKTILEIGCGKGAFLEAMCRTWGARGVGVDPAGDFSRVMPDVDMVLFRETFDGSREGLTGDLICCRHTLEHISEVGAFVGHVAEALRRTPGSVGFFELPDTRRILEEGAFWDVYYEHCSYFTADSLARLFRSKGLTVTRLELGFDDQYLLLDAQDGPDSRAPKAGAVEATVEMCRAFGESAHREITRWQEIISELSNRDQRVVLWGAGSKSVGFLSALGHDEAIEAVVDVNPFKQHSFLPGSAHEIVAPEALGEIEPDLILVMNPVYADEISDMVGRLGVHPQIESLGVVHT
jgi:SAM-dependent methyltransferase